ncbi:arylamine N-acetyltransferase [Mesobacillus maritimus]|uniref:arylamine N-acetyltransferase family protein n=1 Tax=Mesobacillus maritimus TaxID=1643336 RepID=UPI0020406D5B|nr:arylamine N-acetyltransferase [Mesobacillus maritimus]MCM3588783.1 arylamine N-acetyltransferase [Mesobacillus maritimus]MCM3671905.1 arylamine N-acetyltransferase [Mesobacillus maritimus]
MSKVNALFRKRIGILEKEVISFEKLDEVLEKTAFMIPFENLCIVENRIKGLTTENVMEKVLVQREGGLCYELNTILYLFLKENGFDVTMVRGVVYNQMKKDWSETGRTHVANLIQDNGKFYLVDTGFGGNLPLKPVPLTGEVVTSNNGEFRIERNESEHGDFILYMKLKHKGPEWKIGYAFDSKDFVKKIEDLNEIQTVIAEHPESAFNKKPLVTKLTEDGSVTLTAGSFTQWADGQEKKEEMDEGKFKEFKKTYFGLE